MNGGLVLVFYGRGQPMMEMMAVQRGKYRQTAHWKNCNINFKFVKIRFAFAFSAGLFYNRSRLIIFSARELTTMIPETSKKKVGTRRFLILAAVLLVLLAVDLAVPRRQVPPYVGVRTLKDLAELATVEYSVTKIVSYKDLAWYGDRKILFEAAATVKAGIDLNELDDRDIKLDGDSTVTVTLPQPKILLFNMKPEHMREIFNESGILRSDFSNQEKDDLLSQGEKDIRAKVARMDVLQRAGRNARMLIESWLKKTGFKTVQVAFKAKGGRS